MNRGRERPLASGNGPGQDGTYATECPRVAERDDKTGGGKREIAVALSYRPGDGDGAPRVVATGRGTVAAGILERAFANGVKVREDPDLAELLAAVDIDSVIPLEAFMAVAEILAYVYQINQQDLVFLRPDGLRA